MNPPWAHFTNDNYTRDNRLFISRLWITQTLPVSPKTRYHAKDEDCEAILLAAMFDKQRYQKQKNKAHAIYKGRSSIRCPFFQCEIRLNSDGFHHLRFSGGKERTKPEQMLKFRLLPLALDVIAKSGTLQEYRQTMSGIGRRYAKSQAQEMKPVEYWGLVAIVSDPKIKIKVILRKVGNGQIHFWSVMPHGKLNGPDAYRKLYTTLMEND